MIVEAVIFFLVIPIIFLIVVVQIVLYVKNGPTNEASYGTIHCFGLLGLVITLVISGFLIFYIIGSMPPFCTHTDCQAVGYLYMFATPFVIVIFLISELLFFLGYPRNEENEP